MAQPVPKQAQISNHDPNYPTYCSRNDCLPASRWPPCVSRSRNLTRRRRSPSRGGSPTIRGTASRSTARSAIKAGRGGACISSYRNCGTTSTLSRTMSPLRMKRFEAPHPSVTAMPQGHAQSGRTAESCRDSQEHGGMKDQRKSHCQQQPAHRLYAFPYLRVCRHRVSC